MYYCSAGGWGLANRIKYRSISTQNYIMNERMAISITNEYVRYSL